MCRRSEGTASRRERLLHAHDEIYEATYTIEVPRLCRICKHHYGQIYEGVELVCAFYPYGYSGDSCPDCQAKQRLSKSQ